jgi:hypothetical protein
MSAGNRAVDWPKKCFNGLQHWQLGWYADRRRTFIARFDTGYLVKIAAFVDYDLANIDEPVLVNIESLGTNENFVLQYNRASKFNVDTEEKKDEVTITAPGIGGTDGLAGLKAAERYTIPNFNKSGSNLIVQACKVAKGSKGADIMYVSIAFNLSLCSRIIKPSGQFALATVASNQIDLPAPRPAPAPSPSPPFIPGIITGSAHITATSSRSSFWALFANIQKKQIGANAKTPTQSKSDFEMLMQMRQNEKGDIGDDDDSVSPQTIIATQANESGQNHTSYSPDDKPPDSSSSIHGSVGMVPTNSTETKNDNKDNGGVVSVLQQFEPDEQPPPITRDGLSSVFDKGGTNSTP